MITGVFTGSIIGIGISCIALSLGAKDVQGGAMAAGMIFTGMVLTIRGYQIEKMIGKLEEGR